MKLLSGILGLTLTSALALASANAADLYRGPASGGGYKDGPVEPVDSWTGFYVGVNGGYGFDDNSGSITFANSLSERFTLSKSLDGVGGFGGGQIGYNWQQFGSRWVFGVEADIQGADITNSFSGATVTSYSDIWSGKSEIDWFGTARARIGYSFGQALLYGTGGVAFGGVKHSFVRTSSSGAVDADDNTSAGWVAGGGLEYKLSHSWSAKVEYQYIDLGSTKATGSDSAGVTASTNNLDNSFSTVRAGLNYHINSGYEPLK